MIEIKEERLKNLSDYNIPNVGLSNEEIKQILQNQKLRESIEKINIEKLIDVIHTADIKTPVVKNSRQFFVDTHYVLKDIQQLLEESKT